MPNLPIRRMVLYKHGVGFFERFGSVGDDASATLTFNRGEMNDILKSLAAFPQSDGQVVSISYETPEEKQDALEKAPLVLGDREAWLDLVRSLRGCQVRLHIAGGESEAGQQVISAAGSGSEFVVSGCLVGLNQIAQKPEQTLVTLMTAGIEAGSTPSLRTYLLTQVRGLDILDAQSGDDLRYVLDLSHSREDQRSVTIFLDRPHQDLLVSYVAPSPTWRVSYRLVYTPHAAPEGSPVSADAGQLLIQGWGIVDNQLDEDLENVSLTLIAGQPISFVYDLYTPRFVDRPIVADETRTVPAPVMFNAAVQGVAASLHSEPQFSMAEMDDFSSEDLRQSGILSSGIGIGRSPQMKRNLAKATQVQATGIARGEMFQYDVGVPVTIKRGQSAMVPILGATLASRKQHWFNAEKTGENPVVTIVATNTTGLTLERGPATVLEADNYVGEAVLSFTPAEGEFFVPYAVDLGVQVHREEGSFYETAAIALGKGDYLIHDQWLVRQTTYRIENRNPYAISLVIEQRQLQGYELLDTPTPMSETAEFRRWQMPVAARQQTPFCVQERQKISRQEQITSLDYQTLKAFLDGKFIDAALFAQLQGILTLHQQIRRLEQEIQSRTQKQNRIATQQKELTEKLNPLRRDGGEGELRQRFVGKLGALEDKRDRLQSEIADLECQIDELNDQLRQQLQQLQAH